MVDKKDIKSYSDAYLYQKYPLYTKKITDAIMRDPVLDKATDSFQDVIYEVKRSKVSESLVNILQSRNVIFLNCEDPMPRAFKVFAARDIKSKDRNIKIFIDCTNVITKSKNSAELIVDATKLISYLINAGITMIYHKSYSTISRRNNIVTGATENFAKCFTFIIDYLAKVSIQESSKIKVMYLSSMYFLEGVMQLGDTNKSKAIAKKIAGISDRESTMLDILLDKASTPVGVHKGDDPSPYVNIKVFINALRDIMHFNKKAVSTDLIVERWMMQYGPGTVMGLEYFPAFSAMITDAYIGGYINSQKTIEKVCGTSMVTYAKTAIDLIDSVV